MKVGIFGMGAYGMALSSTLIINNCDITMWSAFEDEKENLEKTRKNEKLLPGFELASDIKLTTSVEECAKGKDLLIIVIPVPFIESLCVELEKHITEQHILIASKGIEHEQNLLVHEIVEKHLKTKNIAVISGPSFAIDLIKGSPQALSVASESQETLSTVEDAFSSENVRIEKIKDLVGVELCGSVKNVIAIATGILDGLKVNESTKAMFMVEAINNMSYLLEKFNCDSKTILSYSGIGDLLLTCTSEKSRNFSFGKLLGETNDRTTIEEFLKENTIEGYNTSLSLHEILKEKQQDIPFFDLIYNIATGKQDPKDLLNYLKN